MNERSRLFTAVVVLSVALGIVAAAAGFGAFYFLIGTPRVGVISLEGDISTSMANRLSQQLRYAEQERSIRAVVLRIDSPGGGAPPSEDIYYNVLHLAKGKPVVVVLDGVAASGGYYAAMGGHYIFAKPASIVGNIGAIVRLPTEEPPSETEMPTGPHKSEGASRDGYIRKLEAVKEGFVQTVMVQRGQRLKTDREELSKGEVYLGIEALNLGLVDEMGTVNDAIEKAARLAGLVRYEVVDVQQELAAKEKDRYKTLPSGSVLPSFSEGRWPSYYYLVR